jgi:protein-disulfide isomerase
MRPLDNVHRLTLSLLGTTAVLGLTVLATFASVDSAVAQTTLTQSAIVAPDVGQQSATPVLTVFSDFQCPACKKFAPEMRKIEAGYQGKVKFDFRNYPLSQHKNAKAAARAAEAAAKQGKFEEMHDMLFAKQDEWADLSDPQSAFVGYANSLALNADQFLADFKSAAISEKIAADVKAGDKANLEMTPTVIFNGTRYSGKDLRKLETVIDGTINSTAQR